MFSLGVYLCNIFLELFFELSLSSSEKSLIKFKEISFFELLFKNFIALGKESLIFKGLLLLFFPLGLEISLYLCFFKLVKLPLFPGLN